MDKVIMDQGQDFMYGFIEPQTIQAYGSTLEHMKTYLQTWMAESKREFYIASCIDGYVLLKVIFYEVFLIIRLTTSDWWCGPLSTIDHHSNTMHGCMVLFIALED